MDTWLNKTIFRDLKDKLSLHTEAGFSLMLINDPKDLCAYQSSKIFIDADFVCASDCILYNKKSLADQLAISVQSSNEEFIISSFKKWGKLFADKFEGKFSFALWDRRNKKLIGGRDALGYGNFCYSQTEDSLFFASDLATLLDQPQVNKAVNQKRFYQCFRYANNTAQQTYFKHCHYCPPSHIFEFNDVITTTDYWCLEKKELPATVMDEQTNCRKFISLLSQAIENEHDKKHSLGLMLSGGFDSSLLAAVMAGNNSWQEILTCYSYIFKVHKSCDESKIIKQTVEKLKLDSVQINADELYPFSELPDRTIFKDIVNLDGYAALPESIFEIAGRDSKTILILGHFGDDLFGGNQHKFADLISSHDFKSILRMIFKSGKPLNALSEFLNFGIRPLLPKPVKKFYRTLVKPKNENNIFGIADDQINTIDVEFKRYSNELFHRQNLLKLIYFSNTAEGIYYYRKHLYLGHGLKYVMPYYSKAMIEFFWNLPINQLNKPNKYRWLQRQSLTMVDLMEIANRTNKTEFMDLFATGINKKRKQITQIIENSKLSEKMALPENLMNKLEKSDHLTTDETVAINQYLLAALWWQAINDSNESFNQPNQINIDSENLSCGKKEVWSLDS